jgi:hypothetical protein
MTRASFPEIPQEALKSHAEPERVERVWRRLELDLSGAPRGHGWLRGWLVIGALGVFGLGVAFGSRLHAPAAELEAIGFIGKKRPRMVAVQAAGCAPIVRAYDTGVEHAPRWEDAQTIAAGIRVPQAIGDFLVLRAVRESGGFAIAVTDEAITAAIDEVARAEGLLLCPEGAATYAALQQSLADGRIRRDERALLFNCATGLKYPMPPVGRTLDRLQPIDFATL